MKNLFRIISFLEGVSYLLLMSLGLYYKYALNDPNFVKIFGMPHGILFMLYIVLAASIIPFGTFYIDKKYLR